MAGKNGADGSPHRQDQDRIRQKPTTIGGNLPGILVQDDMPA
jgi:hypothetical protein